jgi:hypothetical protein
MKTYLEATEVDKQITKPCEDCPFRRNAIPGWLAGQSPADYCSMAHSETLIECHCHVKDGKHIQCAGAAIYRANTFKRVALPCITLPADRKSVFATPVEFLEHHSEKKLTPKQISEMMFKALQKRIEEITHEEL